MNLSEINWDFEASGTWPQPIKAAVILVLCVLVAGGGYYYDTMDQLDELERLENKEVELKTSFASKQQKAVNLPEYVKQLEQIQGSLGEMLKQMPTEEEVASLLVDISQTGLASGLEFRLFKPAAQVAKDFYSELPIDIKVIGRYEELGLFVSGLASLPRIVTVHNVDISPLEKAQDGMMLMNAVVKTYKEEAVKPTSGAADKKKRKEAK
ncbi:type 4a pilus biogenesis protein PilO [Methylomicrobium lacus]|uniref:type 4a pilus biogenesis protein PilO n=1 Tax=Methylomicrobium lacus TaxID=136992 RepID=UPI00045E8818|nr:type 4a pilus biogenesis protein PilO [Methylomicrobium lacus]